MEKVGCCCAEGRLCLQEEVGESWCNSRRCSVMLLRAAARLVYPGSIKAFTVVSPFTLPPQNSSSCLDSSFPPSFVSLFFGKFGLKQFLLFQEARRGKFGVAEEPFFTPYQI